MADFDDGLAEKYLNADEISAEFCEKVLRKAVLSLQVTPVFCGSAFKNKGVQPLLDGIVNYLPSPLDGPDRMGLGGKNFDKKILCPTDFKGPLVALAFKVATDSFMGSLTYVRVYSGVLSLGTALFNPRQGKKERAHRLVRMHANTRNEVQELKAGDIGAVVGLKWTTTGDTLCSASNPLVLESMEFPEPVISQVLEARSSSQQGKMLEGLGQLTREDPSSSFNRDSETGQWLLSGMGELHLEVLVDRLRREFGVEVKKGQPQVSYRETVGETFESYQFFEREVGGKKQAVGVGVRICPGEVFSGEDLSKGNKGRGSNFVSMGTDLKIPEDLKQGVLKGCQESLENGILAGYPVIGVQVSVNRLEFSEEWGHPAAAQIASSMALRECLKGASSQLMEPVCFLEVVLPGDFLSSVIGDLNRRRGKVLKTAIRGHLQVIDSDVPLAELFGYATSLRSLTQGRGTFNMKFNQYSQVPDKLQEEILKTMGR